MPYSRDHEVPQRKNIIPRYYSKSQNFALKWNTTKSVDLPCQRLKLVSFMSCQKLMSVFIPQAPIIHHQRSFGGGKNTIKVMTHTNLFGLRLLVIVVTLALDLPFGSLA